MPIQKARYDLPYAQIPNATLRATHVSRNARAILFYLLSLPEDWKLHRTQLAKEENINIKTLQKYLNELKATGFIEYVRKKTNGRWSGGTYFVYPEPQERLLEQQKETPSKIKGSTADPKSGPAVEASKIKGSTADPKSGTPVKRNSHDLGPIQIKTYTNTTTTSEAPPKITLPVFIDRVVEGMSTSSVPGWFVAEMAAELWEQYSHPKTAMAMKIIYTDWTNTA